MTSPQLARRDLATLLALGALAPRAVLAAPDRAAAWREDIEVFGREIPKRHANAFHRLARPEFERMVAELQRDAPGLADHQVVVRLLMITAAIGDGHTYVRMPESYGRYPFGTYVFGDELRVTRAVESLKPALGARLVGVGPLSIVEVRKRLTAVMSQDENRWWSMANTPGYLARPQVLHTLGVVADLGSAPFVFEDDAGKRFTLPVEPAPLQPAPAMVNVTETLPLYRQRPEEGLWWTQPDPRTFYVAFRNYDTLMRRWKALFEQIDASGADRIVVDMRLNGGGDYTIGQAGLVYPISQRPKLNRRGGLYVVTGRGTFSAAMSNAGHFHKMPAAILVGEPPGEKPNSYQENRRLTLPNSKVEVSYSTRLYRFIEEDADAIPIDKPIETSWQDYRRARDPVLEWILAQA